MEFIDLKKQYLGIKGAVDSRIESVINNANYIQGKEVEELEGELSNFIGSHCTSVANGTDALYISLVALDIKAGDEIIVPSFTWVSTVQVVKQVGAVPVYVDIDIDTFNLNLNCISEKITPKTKAIIGVSLFGRCIDLRNLKLLCEKHNLKFIEDAAQSFGAMSENNLSCSIADISTTSFFPAKPFGCYGDGGAIFTNDKDLNEKVKIISKNGQIKRYDYKVVGCNSRLDTIQAAILLEKFAIFPNEIRKRTEIAKEYNSLLEGIDWLKLPQIPSDSNRSVWAQYTILLDDKIKDQRKLIMSLLKERNIPTALYYPVPIHKSKPYEAKEELPITENVADRVLSLPMHPYLELSELKHVSISIKEVFKDIGS